MTGQLYLNLYKEAKVENLSIVRSDRGPVLTTNHGTGQVSFLPLRFETNLLLQDSFMLLVQQTWSRYVNGSNVYQLDKQIKILRQVVKF